MSEVVLRCPNCGTTQDALGECEACHESGVRWWCPNHNPGRWLDAPACAGCGATRHHGPPPRDPAPIRAPARTPEPERIELPSRAPRTPTSTRAATPPDGSGEVDAFDPLEMFRRAAAAAAAAREAEAPEPERERPRVAPRRTRGGPSVAGCAVRLVLVLGVLVLLAIAALWFLAGGAVSSFVVDVGQSTGVMTGVPAQTTRGIEAYRAGDLTTAEQELDEAARTYRRSALALLYLARIRIDAGDSDAVGPLLDEAVTREPDNALAHRMLGEFHLTRARRALSSGESRVYTVSELGTAEAELARAIALDPSDARARGYHACALIVGGRAPEARSELAAAGPGPWDSCAPGRR